MQIPSDDADGIEPPALVNGEEKVRRTDRVPGSGDAVANHNQSCRGVVQPATFVKAQFAPAIGPPEVVTLTELYVLYVLVAASKGA